jgi:hypothetical protein
MAWRKSHDSIYFINEIIPLYQLKNMFNLILICYLYLVYRDYLLNVIFDFDK